MLLRSESTPLIFPLLPFSYLGILILNYLVFNFAVFELTIVHSHTDINACPMLLCL